MDAEYAEMRRKKNEYYKQRYANDPEYRARRLANSKRFLDKIKDTEEYKENNKVRTNEYRLKNKKTPETEFNKFIEKYKTEELNKITECLSSIKLGNTRE
jgi:chromatin segregation and condensation protein Rec8/ScpA/Scc1 (kleisin family)